LEPETYLGLPSPDPTSSESGKGIRGLPTPTLGLISSGSRLRVSQRDCSMTARSPSGERHPSVSRRAMAPLLRSVSARPPRSLARSGGDRGGEEENELGFGETRHPAPVLLFRGSLTVVDSRWTAIVVLGLNRPRWAGEMSAQAFAPFCDFQVGWAGPESVYGPFLD
jgi:hypothetical protein